jgi:hypothetical protein
MSPEPELVHFVERRLGFNDSPQSAVKDLSGSQRLSNVLIGGFLRAFHVIGSSSDRIVAASDISHAELHHAFRTGLNARGPVRPWAVVLRREKMWELGMRPVIYAEASVSERFRGASETIRGPGWGALVVRTELAPQTRNDWTHEREWRFCFPYAAQPFVDIRTAVRAVVVGEQGWLPTPVSGLHLDLALTYFPTYSVERWHWNGQTLVHDGSFRVESDPERGTPPHIADE